MQFNQLKDMIYLAVLVGTPVVSVTGAFYSGQQRLADFRLEVEQKYSHKDEIAKMSEKINTISTDVAEIKGMLKTRQYSKLEPFSFQGLKPEAK